MRVIVALLAAVLCVAPARADNVRLTNDIVQMSKSAKFTGSIYVERARKKVVDTDTGRLLTDMEFHREADRRLTASNPVIWRWASVTKQVVAVLVMQEVEAGRIKLDAPVSTYLSTFASANAGRATIRHLLQHRAGLPDPSATPKDAKGVPTFYTRAWTSDRLAFCAGPVTGAPGGNWAYNNCDYLVLGAVLEAVTGKSFATLYRERIANPARLSRSGVFPTRDFVVPGYIDEEREPPIDLASYGASAGLYGRIEDVVKFDRALLDGKLLKPESRAELWRGDPALGYMALGQWVFDAPLKGCAGPVRIVERRGEIGAVGVRNFILPQKDMIVVAFTNRGGFDFGEIWQGKGFSHDLLSAAACP